MSNNESINDYNKISDKDKSKNIQNMFNNIAGKYDFLNGLLSLNLDNRWRRIAIKKADIHDNDLVLDLACGTGDLTRAIKHYHPKCSIISGDFSINMLYIAKKKLPDNIFVASDAHFLPFVGDSFDRLTIAFGFRNVTDKAKGLKEFYRVLKPNGKVCILELTQPENKFINLCYSLYFRHILPFIAGMFSSKQAYEYLPDSVSSFPKRKKFKQLIEQAGFKNIKFKSMLFGAVTIAVMEK